MRDFDEKSMVISRLDFRRSLAIRYLGEIYKHAISCHHSEWTPIPFRRSPNRSGPLNATISVGSRAGVTADVEMEAKVGLSSVNMRINERS